jgi:hypothetical protein
MPVCRSEIRRLSGERPEVIETDVAVLVLADAGAAQIQALILLSALRGIGSATGNH